MIFLIIMMMLIIVLRVIFKNIEEGLFVLGIIEI